MVQFVQMPQQPRSVGQAIAEGLGEGISRGVEMGLQERFLQRQEDRKNEQMKSNILNFAKAKAKQLGLGSNNDFIGYLYEMGQIDPASMVKYDPSPVEIEQLMGDMEQHRQEEYRQASKVQSPDRMNQYPMQRGYDSTQEKERTGSAIKSTNINPLAIPPGQIQSIQPGAIERPSAQVSEQAQFPKVPQPVQEQPAEEDRFKTITIRGKPIKVVKDPSLIRTIDEGKVYSDNYLRPDQRKAFMTDLRANIDLKQKERKVSAVESAEKRAYEKDSKDYIKKINASYEATLKKRPIFKMMEEKAGEIQPMSVYRKALSDRWGLPPGAVFNNTEQVIDKLGNQLLQGVSSSFDQARILQTEVESFIKANPSLLNSPEGLQKLAKISMAIDDIPEKKWQLTRSIVKDARSRGEMIPEDLEDQVLEKEADFVEDSIEKIRNIMSSKGIQGTLNLEVGQEVKGLPSPSKAGENAVFEDTDTGDRYISTGKGWRKLKK